MAYSSHETARSAGRRDKAAGSECLSCAIRGNSFCGVIPDFGMSDLAQSRRTFQFEKSQTIVSAGQPATHIFNVTSGIVKLYRATADGRTQIIGFRVPGEFFATADVDKYASTAEALTCVQVCSFPRNRLDQLVSRYPALQTKMLEMTYRQLATLEEQMFLLGRKTARERVASFLLLYGRKPYHGEDKKSCASLPITRADMADFLGLTTETVSRVISAMSRMKIITIGRQQTINLVDISALWAMSGSEIKSDPQAGRRRTSIQTNRAARFADEKAL